MKDLHGLWRISIFLKDFKGFCRISNDFEGSQRTLKDPKGFCRISIYFKVCQRILNDLKGFCRITNNIWRISLVDFEFKIKCESFWPKFTKNTHCSQTIYDFTESKRSQQQQQQAKATEKISWHTWNKIVLFSFFLYDKNRERKRANRSVKDCVLKNDLQFYELWQNIIKFHSTLRKKLRFLLRRLDFCQTGFDSTHWFGKMNHFFVT